MARKITPATTLDNLKREAKRWLKAVREKDTEARERLKLAYPGVPDQPGLRDVQHALAREYGAENWNKLRAALWTQQPGNEPPRNSREAHQRAAEDFVKAYESDAAALERLNWYYRRSFTFDD